MALRVCRTPVKHMQRYLLPRKRKRKCARQWEAGAGLGHEGTASPALMLQPFVVALLVRNAVYCCR